MNLLNFYTNPYVKGEIEAAPGQIGTPWEDMLFSPGPQERPDTCAIRVQQHILSMYGIEKSEAELLQDAALQGEFDPSGFSGTAMEDAGNLLERNGLEINRYTDATIAHLISELGQGHKVLAAVDAYELRAETWPQHLTQSLLDTVRQDSNHAVLVVDVNPHTLDVVIVDPLDGNPRVIPSEQFLDAWKDSDCFMVSTAQSPDAYLKTAEHESMDVSPAKIDKGEIAMTNLLEKYLNPESDAADKVFEPSFGSTIYDPSGLNNPDLPASHPDNRLSPAEYRFLHPHGPSFGASEAARNDGFEPSFGSTEAARNDGFEPSFGSTEAARNDGFSPSFGTSEAARSDGMDGPDADGDVYDLSIADLAVVNGDLVMGFDINDDGVSDVYAVGMDFDGDGSVDSIAFDMTGDGSPDGFTLDLDGDGSLDAVALDIDGDGVPDELYILDDSSSMI